jgi:hypothetical protein
MNGTWTDAQQQLVTQTIQHEVEDSRLAHKVIPEYTLATSARAVSAETFDYATGRVDDVTQLALEERQEPFSLTRQQAEDDDLSSAVVIIRRATQRLAIDHDDRVFRVSIRDPIDNAANTPGAAGAGNFNPIVVVARVDDSGEGMVAATAAAVATLDGQGYRTGFVMVAGLNLYRLLNSRATGAADLPIVAVRGLLEGGPVHRLTVLNDDEALVLSVGAGRIDRAVAVAPVAEFLRVEQAQGEELRLWRLYERFLTRFKETKSAVLLRLSPPPGGGAPARGVRASGGSAGQGSGGAGQGASTGGRGRANRGG